MEVLRKLVEEHTPINPSNSSSSSSSSNNSNNNNNENNQNEVNEGGILILLGSIDWDKVTTKTCSGLDIPTRIQFNIPVLKTFTSSSSRHFFILLKDGSLYGMGLNDFGQLGNNNLTTHNSPVLIRQPWNSTLSIVKITTGRSHSLFLLNNGEVYGCGSNSCGQLGLGSNIEKTSTPTLTPLSNIRDIASGYEHSLACTFDGKLFAFGHPEYGQLGDGSTGEYIQQSKKVSYNYVTRPKLIKVFVTKDNRGDITQSLSNDEIKIRCVSAGRNHSSCIEDWEDENGNEKENRVYSWGFGGYGRLGHSSASDEHVPREVTVFSPIPGRSQFPQKQIRQLYCGSTYSLYLSKSHNLYFNGILPNSPRKEAITYPRIQQELYEWDTKLLSGGSGWVLISADSAAIFWGAPVAGSFGLEHDAKRSAVPTFVSAVSDMKILDVSSSYSHSCIVVTKPSPSPPTTTTITSNETTTSTSTSIETKENESKNNESNEHFERVINSYPILEVEISNNKNHSSDNEEEEEENPKKKKRSSSKKASETTTTNKRNKTKK